MIVDRLYTTIQKGMKGLNQGLSTGLDKLDSIIYGVNRGWMYTIAGPSGGGKSILALYSAIYQPYKQMLEEHKEDNIHFLLFSFEMSAEVLLTKILSMYIWDTFHKEISYADILSLASPLTEEDYTYIKDSQDWLMKFEQHCEIIDKPVTAKHLYGITKEWTKQFGEYIEEESFEGYVKTTYIPKDPQQYLIINVDHIKLLKADSGNTAKQEIDHACDYLITFRNKCNCTVFILQQLNRNFQAMDRRTANNGQYQLLELQDLSDSSGPAQASEIVLGIYHPFREKQSRCEGYDIRQLRDNIRMLCLLKSRYGLADRVIGCNFFGSVGLWKCLPLPQDIKDYEPYTKLN